MQSPAGRKPDLKAHDLGENLYTNWRPQLAEARVFFSELLEAGATPSLMFVYTGPDSVHRCADNPKAQEQRHMSLDVKRDYIFGGQMLGLCPPAEPWGRYAR